MFALLQPFVFPNIDAVKFAIKVLIAGGVALFISFCMDLDQPHWAAATAIIVAQPHSGMVISKGLARLVGTVAGTVAAVIMTALFSQTPWLFIFAIAIGLTLCTAASAVIRSAWSYAFVLAGYTAAIIVLPDIYKPLSVFDYAVARCTEISLGIICSSLVFALVWPVRVHSSLVEEASKVWKAGLLSACSALNGQSSNESLLDSLAKIVAIDVQREHALFEGGDGRNRARAIQNMSHDILALLRATRGVARQWRNLSPESIEQLKPWLDECIEKLTIPTHKSLTHLARRLHGAAQASSELEQKAILIRLEMAIRYATSAGLDLSSVRSGKLHRKAKSDYLAVHRDYSLGLFFGLRSGIAFIVVAIFWMLWGWPISEASGALTMVAVTCSIFANREDAAQMSMGFFKGVCYAAVVCFIVSQLIIPSWSGFPLLWLALGVPLFFASLGRLNLATAGTCTVFSINIMMLCKPSNHTFQSTETILNSSLAMPLGILSAVMAFHLIKINTPYWQGRYMLDIMLKDLGRLALGSIKGAEMWFGGRMADRLILLARHREVMADNAEERWNDALHIMDIGDEMLNLRASLVGQRALKLDLQEYLETLAKVFEKEPNTANTLLLNKASKKLKKAIKEKDEDVNSSLALSSIRQLQVIWFKWYRLPKQQEIDHGIA